ncbi:hypothetical protein NL676_003843 [Syzygium grande]|nr:hypothetical protein NL676_003843 [Syzygium grande]
MGVGRRCGIWAGALKCQQRSIVTDGDQERATRRWETAVQRREGWVANGSSSRVGLAWTVQRGCANDHRVLRLAASVAKDCSETCWSGVRASGNRFAACRGQVKSSRESPRGSSLGRKWKEFVAYGQRWLSAKGQQRDDHRWTMAMVIVPVVARWIGDNEERRGDGEHNGGRAR